jgi:hypothetical protein
MSALTTHTSNQFREKEKKKRNNWKTQTSDQKPNKSQEISLEWEQSRSPKTRATTRHNRDKNAPKLLTPQGGAKGLDTIGKRAQIKFRQKRAPKCMNASSPLNKCISPKTLPGNMNWVLSSPLLAMHESSLQMQSCASQIYKKHYNMLKFRHRQER